MLAQVKKSSTIQTSLNATPKVIGTPSTYKLNYSDPIAPALAVHVQRKVPMAKPSHTHSDAESLDSRHMSAASETDNDGQNPSHLPTPFATTNEPKAQTMQTHFKEQLTWKFHQVIEDSGMQTLMEVDDAISADLAYASQPEEQDPEARFLPLVMQQSY
ncbi:hypothetical protein RSAG8_12981, partial [Rhizoctonia solani AG-8 WAC10335]